MSKKKPSLIQTHILIDTNVLIRICTQSKSGFEFEHWEKLTSLVDKGALQLIMPEVVELEFRTFIRTLEKAFKDKLEAFTKFESREPVWNELDQLKQHLRNAAKEWGDIAQKEWRERLQKVLRWIDDSKLLKKVPVLDAMVAYKVRMITRRMPPKPDNPKKNEQDKIDHDLMILESAFLSFKQEFSGKQLLVCTENLEDFEATPKSKVVHLKYGEDLPPNRIFADLASMMKSIDLNERIEPLTEEQIEELETESVLEELTDVRSCRSISDLIPQVATNSLSASYLGYREAELNEARKLVAPIMKQINDIQRVVNSIRPLTSQINQISEVAKILKSISPEVSSILKNK